MKPQNARQNIPKIIPLVAAALLAGCGTAPPATQTVYVPVHTPCLNEVPVAPLLEFDKLQLGATAGEKVLALARDWPRQLSYTLALEASIAGCR